MRTIRVTGKGQIKVKPDITRITMTLTGVFKEYGETLRHSSEDTEALKDVLSAFGFERPDALAPGWIKTGLSAALVADMARYESVKARIPMGDWGEPDVFKGVAVLLASSASDYINGAIIPVDGGYLTK